MLEKLYTRKVIVALMALILAANGFLLYQFQIKPPTQTANTPSSEESPGVPDTPGENIGEADDSSNQVESNDESNGAENGGAEDQGEDEEPPANPPGSPDEAPAAESAPEDPAATPFDSQYGSPPTEPDSISGSGDPSRIRVALASFYDPVDGSGDEISILPATSGFASLPEVAAACAVVLLAGAAVILVKRR